VLASANADVGAEGGYLCTGMLAIEAAMREWRCRRRIKAQSCKHDVTTQILHAVVQIAESLTRANTWPIIRILNPAPHTQLILNQVKA
jgi:hypothetical protein